MALSYVEQKWSSQLPRLAQFPMVFINSGYNEARLAWAFFLAQQRLQWKRWLRCEET